MGRRGEANRTRVDERRVDGMRVVGIDEWVRQMGRARGGGVDGTSGMLDIRGWGLDSRGSGRAIWETANKSKRPDPRIDKAPPRADAWGGRVGSTTPLCRSAGSGPGRAGPGRERGGAAKFNPPTPTLSPTQTRAHTHTHTHTYIHTHTMVGGACVPARRSRKSVRRGRARCRGRGGRRGGS